MRTFIFLPPLPRMSGGLAVLQKLGEYIHRAGFSVYFVARERAAWFGDFLREGMPPLLLWESGDAPKLDVPLGTNDIWLIPEGWPHSILPGLRAGCRTVIYVQNWAYLLSEWPEGLDPAKLPVHYLAVSRPVAWHIREVTGRHATLLRPGIDISFFHPSCDTEHAKNYFQQHPVIGWMPRKNKALSRHIREIVAARRTQQHLVQPEWLEIANMTQAQVAEALRRCDIFLATGFPEGCPLPPLEAMASGCISVGFAGFGGWDYMREETLDSHREDSVGLLPFWLPESLRDEADPRPANGFWVSDGDVIGAALAMDNALALMEPDQANRRLVLAQAARKTAELYSLDVQNQRIQELWQCAAKNILFVGADH